MKNHIIKELRLDEVEEYESLNDENYSDQIHSIEVATGDEYGIITTNVKVLVKDYGIELRNGTFCTYDKKTNEYSPDWTITLLYMAGAKPEEYVYYEQDSYKTTLLHYLEGRKDINENEKNPMCILAIEQ